MKASFLSRILSIALLLTTSCLKLMAQNVGIGTNSPQEKLHIVNGNLLLSPNTGGIGATHFSPRLRLQGRKPVSGDLTGISYGLDFEINTTAVGSIRSVSSPVLGDYLSITRSNHTGTDLTIASNGNVGVGLANPSARLHVHNGNLRLNYTNGNPQIELQRGGENKGFLHLTGDNGDNLRIGTFSGIPGSFIIQTGGANRLTVNSSGNITIGTASTTHALNVGGTTKLQGDGELLLLNGSGSSRYIQFYRNNVAKAFIQLTDDDLFLGTTTGNTTGNLRLDANRVVIGSTTPATGYKLSVGGRVICTELRVELAANWPDYVFEDSYSLPSLDKVEEHIQQHKHLPNIPSSSQIAETGLHLGEMQRLQMEKIEELFLHVIALKKELEAVKAENKYLKTSEKQTAAKR